jgi:chromosome segregation ATPase
MMTVWATAFRIWVAARPASTPAPAPAVDPASVVPVGQLASVLISATVLAAAISALVAWLNNRRNARIQERKNAADEGSDLVSRYKEAASEERAAKESAVRTVQNLLDISQQQVTSLQSTVGRLNDTIMTLQRSTESQQVLIDAITEERDRLQQEQEHLQQQIDEKRQELLSAQQEILELTYPKSVVTDIRKTR